MNAQKPVLRRSSNQYRALKTKLHNSSGHDFQRKIYDLLKPLFPSLKYAADLRELDRSGIDLVTFNPDGSYDAIIQCKGFEVAGFGSSQFDQCAKSIDTFKRSDIRAYEYVFIHNREPHIQNYRETYRDKLEKELATLTNTEQVEEITLYDLERFIDFFVQLIEVDLRDAILRSNNQFRDAYMQRMQQHIYIESVPFDVVRSDRETYYDNLEDPIAYLEQLLESDADETLKQSVGSYDYRSQRTEWTFVISEFGYGKTSLLLNLAFAMRESNRHFLYVPLAVLNNDFHSNNYKLAASIVRLLPMQLDESTQNFQFYCKVLDLMLKRRSDMLILIDGLDESAYLHTSQGLMHFFNLFREYNSPVIFSARQEFTFERGSEFERASKLTNGIRQELFLREWKNEQIATLTKWYMKNEPSQKLNEFYDMVQNDHYEELYGDIPKRPLFLQMILDDIRAGVMQATDLDALYESYFMRKFSIDRGTSAGGLAVNPRPLDVPGAFDKIADRFMLILEELAASSSDDRETFDEEVLEEIIKHYFLQIDDIVQFLLHAVLIPDHARSSTQRTLSLRFAHKSFREYFLKRYERRTR